MRPLKTGVVLGGGAARGAYEAGVISYLRDELEPELGRTLNLDVLCGTSVGAVHASYLAATAHAPKLQGQGLIDRWRAMRVEEVLDVGMGDILRLARDVMGRPSSHPHAIEAGGLVHPRGLRALVWRTIPWLWVGRNLRQGRYSALSVSATEVARGVSTLFVQRGGAPLRWGRNPNFRAVRTRIGPKHILASGAIPLVFPAVRIQGHLYVDGGLQLNVPMSPAINLGAERILVVSLRHKEDEQEVEPAESLAEERSYVTAPFLFGKALNALMLDRTDQDLQELERVNVMLEAGTRAYGPAFRHTLNEALGRLHSPPLRYVRPLLVRPSRNIGEMAAEHACTPSFRARAKGLTGKFLLRLADQEARRSSDLISYLMFDGEFADRLIELGRSDARALGDRWRAFFSDEPTSAAEEAQAADAERADRDGG